MTTNSRLPRSLPTAVAVLCLLAGACDLTSTSGDTTVDDARTDGVETDGVDAPAGTDVDDEPSGDATSETSEDALLEASPLNDFINVANGEVDDAAAERDQREHDIALAACMADEGFEWVPFGDLDHLDNSGPWALPRDEFVAAYGYGITTIEADELPVYRDPNQDRVDAMSPAERTAWYRALYGGTVGLDEEGHPGGPVEATTLDPDDEGCSGQAVEEVWGDRPSEDKEAFAAFTGLLDDIGALHDRVAQDARVVAATQAWSDCMTDAGFHFTEPNAARDDVRDRILALQDHDGPASRTDREIDAVAARGGLLARDRFGDLDPEALADVRAHELEVAATDHACRAQTELERIQANVRIELEEAFIEERRTELEAYRELLGASGPGAG